MESGFDYVAVLAAAIAAMVVGALWYSPLLFEKQWRKLSGVAADDASRSMAGVFGGAFVLMILGAAVFHAFLGADPDPGFAIGVGAAAGLAWAAGSLWISYLFEGRPTGLYLINGGFHFLQYTVYGLVFGLM